MPDDRALERLRKGISLDGRRTAPAKVALVPQRPSTTSTADKSIVEITIHEGRNRQVREMFDAVGHPVLRLRRVRIGPIVDDESRPATGGS